MKTRLLTSLIISAGLAGMGSYGRAQSIADQAMSGKSRQGEIQASSQALVGQVDAMIDEYQRNGLNGEDIKNLKSLRVVLGKMSEKDMARVLALLQQAGVQNDPAAALKVIAAAYSQQKGMIVEMKQILATYASEDEALELSQSAMDLADREAANLQTGIETARWTISSKDQAAIDASLQGQSAEQKAISDEMKILQAKLADFAKDPNNKALAERFNQGLRQMANVAPMLDAAANSLDQKKVFDAAMSEKTARDQMRQLARTIAPPKDDADALRDAVEQLGKLISQQTDVISQTTDAVAPPIKTLIEQQLNVGEHSPIGRLVKRNGWGGQTVDQLAAQAEMQRLYLNYCYGKAHSADGVDSREGDLANQTDGLRQDLEQLAKPAADALEAALPPMQGASTALAAANPAAALQPENDALAGMNKAMDALRQQLAAAEKADQASGDPIADIEETQKEAQALMQQQGALARETAAPKTPQQAAADAQQQGALQAKAQDLQQRTAADAPAASQSLSKAAGNMQQAAGAMGNPPQAGQAQAGQAQAGQAQAQAMQNLANAVSQLGQQIAQLQQQQQAMVAAQKELEEVEKLIAAEQSLQADTVKAAPVEARERAGIEALAPRQQSIRSDTDEFQKTLAADPQGSAYAQKAASASGHMGDAQGHLGAGEATAANPDEGKALDDLYVIKDDLAAEIQADQNQLGQQDQADANADQSAANAAAAVAQAQADAAAGTAAAAQGANQQAAGEMSQAASTAAAAAAQAGSLPAGAQQAMRAAAAAAAQAAGAAAAGQSAQAQASGQSAQQALAAAAAALAQAQAGLAAAGGPGSGPPGGPPGPPGTSPGPGGPGQGGPPGPPGPSTGNGPGNIQIADGAQTVGQRLFGGQGNFLKLPARDRATIEQSQSEKYPPQYAGKVEQYLENLANDNGQ
jgi:hypothetical protein